MTIGVNCGHTIRGAGCGALGILNESKQTRLVGYALMEKLKSCGVNVVDCTVNEADSQEAYLSAVADMANMHEMDWFISIHFNASASHKGRGCEVYTYKGKLYPEALAVCANIARLGFPNRGIKNGSNLYIIRKTKAKAMLIEICFCDNQGDVDVYNCIGAEDAVAQAILNSIVGQEIKWDKTMKDNPDKVFEEFVGEIAKRDWKERRIMLPSVVVAQAIKESARGTSELAQKANALFGIKKNGWGGRTYIKAATEQRPDGSFYTVENTEWRAYDNWEQSILDHNDYIATRSTDGGKTLRFHSIIGCDNYRVVCQKLEECSYATAVNYAESLINDYIKKYNLVRFDE